MEREEAIRELQFLADQYREVEDSFPESTKQRKACEMGIMALETVGDLPPEIDWIPAKYETTTKIGHSVMHGFACNNCDSFSQQKSRYCKDCGGIFRGTLRKSNANADIRFGGF